MRQSLKPVYSRHDRVLIIAHVTNIVPDGGLLRNGGPPRLLGPPTSGPYPKHLSSGEAHYFGLSGTNGGMGKPNRWQVFWTLNACYATPQFALKLVRRWCISGKTTSAPSPPPTIVFHKDPNGNSLSNSSILWPRGLLLMYVLYCGPVCWPTMPQRTTLDPYIRRLAVARSRSLHTGTCRSLMRLTRTLWEAFRTLVADVVPEGLPRYSLQPRLPHWAGIATTLCAFVKKVISVNRHRRTSMPAWTFIE